MGLGFEPASDSESKAVIFSIVLCLLSPTKPGLTRGLPEEQQEKEKQEGSQLGREGWGKQEGDSVTVWWHLLQDSPTGCQVTLCLKDRTSALKYKAGWHAAAIW